MLRRLHRFGADGVLHQEGEGRADVAHDIGRAGLLARLEARAVVVRRRRDEAHGAAAWPCRPIRDDGVATHDQHAGGARSADEFVGRDDDGVDRRIGCRCHRDRQVWSAAGIVPDHQRAGRLGEAGDADDVGNDARHVRGGREGADDAPPRPCLCKGVGKRVEIRPALAGLGDLDHLGAAFAPRQDVGMMFVRADDDERPRADAEQSGQPVDASSGAGAGEDHRVVLRGAAAGADRGACLAAQPGHEATAVGRLGVAVGIVGQHLFEHETLDLHQRATGRDIVGVDHWLLPERSVDHGILADETICQGGNDVGVSQAVAECGKQSSGEFGTFGVHRGCSWEDLHGEFNGDLPLKASSI